MLLKVLQKTALMGSAGGAGGAVYLSGSVDVSDTLPSKQINLQNASVNKSINSLEDIELFEKLHNCNFVFVGTWSPQKTWNSREFLNQYKDNKTQPWEKLVIAGANKTKNHCKDKKVATLSFWNNAFSLKTS